ncbi:Leucine-rich repeat containing protein [Entamoeba histolytica HM-3:IMSS]|uniref:Leucine-rich repeat containing protein n=1 Tax=Entamoeba histolytica HM-3:IMSS TaxID=885315 RepID=M7WX39_ENTHI|nr:Leucine-rich repeat containing protein [Entamoeba histolytica HM-3:IMSS]
MEVLKSNKNNDKRKSTGSTIQKEEENEKKQRRNSEGNKYLKEERKENNIIEYKEKESSKENKKKEILFIPFEKSDKEKEKDEKIKRKGGLGLEEIIAVIMYSDSINTVINMRYVSKHIYSAIRHVSTNPYYSEKKINKTIGMKKRIITARKDLLVFRNLKHFKGQLETIETIMANKLLKYESLMIINDFSNVNHNIFQSIKHKVIDLTIILYPEIIIDFEGLISLKRLRIDFNNNDVSIFEELIKECLLKIKKNNKLKEIYFKCNGRYSLLLGKILSDCDLINQEIYIRFDKITEGECQGFIQNNHLLISL